MRLRRPLWGNAALAILAPALFLLLLETLLAVAGVRPLALTEDPLVGFSSQQPLFVEDPVAAGAAMKTNPAKLSHFNPQGFPRKKPDGAFRIFAVGGSTTYGHPWRDPVSYSGWLRELLPAADPSRRWEVINAGGISYASYREARLVEEITRYQPDLILVYSGHNEFLEERTYRSTAGIPAWLRETSALLDRTRTYTAMRTALRKIRGQSRTRRIEAPARRRGRRRARPYHRPQDLYARRQPQAARAGALPPLPPAHGRTGAKLRRPGAFPHHARQRTGLLPLQERAHARALPAAASAADALLRRADSLEAAGQLRRAWPPRSPPPLRPLRPFAAADALDSAVGLDPRNAGILYRAGKAALAAGRHDAAKRLLVRALEEDVCPLRALPAMRDIVLEVARETGSEALDVTAALEARTRARLGHDILGEPEFVDHVHLSIDEYRAIALGVMDKLAASGDAQVPARLERRGA